MRKTNSDVTEQVQAIDLTPMLDVIFIMLIFFVVTASFIKTPGIEIDKTTSVTAEEKTPGILVAIDADNEIWIDQQVIPQNLVTFKLQQLSLENPGSSLVIQVDSEAEVGKIGLVAGFAKEIGIAEVSVSTLNK